MIIRIDQQEPHVGDKGKDRKATKIETALFFSFLLHTQIMANAISVLAKKRSVSALVIALIYALYKAKKHFQSKAAGSNEQNSTTRNKTNANNKRKGKGKVGVNATFFKQMKELLPICIPGK